MQEDEIVDIYRHFLTFLCGKKDYIAPLQLTGRLEDYLVHEFIIYAFNETHGELLGLTNLGKKGEQKYDIAFLRNNSGDEKEIAYAFEVKYIRNAHRIYEKEEAGDEITSTLKSLSKQLEGVIGENHGEYPVCQKAVGTKVYGLVFASCRKPDEKKMQEKEDFYNKKILGKAKGKGFSSFISNDGEPTFDKVYDDIEVKAVGLKYYLTLRAGLWHRHI